MIVPIAIAAMMGHTRDKDVPNCPDLTHRYSKSEVECKIIDTLNNVRYAVEQLGAGVTMQYAETPEGDGVFCTIKNKEKGVHFEIKVGN